MTTMNQERAESARQGLVSFALMTGLDKDDWDTIVKDFLTNLRYLASQEQRNFDALLERSQRYFEDECVEVEDE